MKLTQALVTRYAKLSALKNLIDKWLDEKKPLILEALALEPCPEKGPYVLVRAEVAQGPNWKSEFAMYLGSHGKTQQEIAVIFEGIQKLERDKAVRLEKKINPNYRKTFTVMLPA